MLNSYSTSDIPGTTVQPAAGNTSASAGDASSRSEQKGETASPTGQGGKNGYGMFAIMMFIAGAFGMVAIIIACNKWCCRKEGRNEKRAEQEGDNNTIDEVKDY